MLLRKKVQVVSGIDCYRYSVNEVSDGNATAELAVILDIINAVVFVSYMQCFRYRNLLSLQERCRMQYANDFSDFSKNFILNFQPAGKNKKKFNS